MGGCVSPTLANIFLSHLEEKWLEQCPINFKPVLYRRYVDDTFLLFRNTSEINQFFVYINNQNPRIKFTFEIEKSATLPFLDIQVINDGNGFSTNMYRKPT